MKPIFSAVFVITIHLLPFKSILAAEVPSHPIPSRCQVIDTKTILTVTGITAEEQLSYSREICLGINGANCGVAYSPATCNRVGTVYRWLEEGVEKKLSSEKSVCDYFFSKYSATKFAGREYSCSLSSVQLVPQTWVPYCYGATNRGDLTIKVKMTNEELKPKRCEALTDCLIGNDLTSKERKTVGQYLEFFKCE